MQITGSNNAPLRLYCLSNPIIERINKHLLMVSFSFIDLTLAVMTFMASHVGKLTRISLIKLDEGHYC